MIAYQDEDSQRHNRDVGDGLRNGTRAVCVDSHFLDEIVDGCSLLE